MKIILFLCKNDCTYRSGTLGFEIRSSSDFSYMTIFPKGTLEHIGTAHFNLNDEEWSNIKL